MIGKITVYTKIPRQNTFNMELKIRRRKRVRVKDYQ